MTFSKTVYLHGLNENGGPILLGNLMKGFGIEYWTSGIRVYLEGVLSDIW